MVIDMKKSPMLLRIENADRDEGILSTSIEVGALIVLIAALIFVLATPSCASADEWRTRDTLLEVTYAAAHIADWSQTHRIATDPYVRETNLILGPAPSSARINTYFTATLLGHVAVSAILPPKWRTRWQLVTIAVESSYVAWNVSIGYKLEF